MYFLDKDAFLLPLSPRPQENAELSHPFVFSFGQEKSFLLASAFSLSKKNLSIIFAAGGKMLHIAFSVGWEISLHCICFKREDVPYLIFLWMGEALDCILRRR